MTLAMGELGCYSHRGARQYNIPAEFGFSDERAMRRAALAARYDYERAEEKEQACTTEIIISR